MVNQPEHQMNASRYEQTRVAKRLAPHQPGALKLAARFGERLVCVRYRHDLTAGQRYTTVELVVEQAPIKPRAERRIPQSRLVALRIDVHDRDLRQSLQANGAVWDAQSRVWYVQKTTAKALGLLEKIV
jgi:hypothetical protein